MLGSRLQRWKKSVLARTVEVIRMVSTNTLKVARESWEDSAVTGCSCLLNEPLPRESRTAAGLGESRAQLKSPAFQSGLFHKENLGSDNTRSRSSNTAGILGFSPIVHGSGKDELSHIGSV